MHQPLLGASIPFDHERPRAYPIFTFHTLAFVTFSAFCSAASGKEEKETEPEPETTTSAPNSSSANRKLYDIDDSLTLETLERMSLDLAEQIMEIDVERSYEFEKRSGSKPRSRSKSKQSADPSSNLNQSHVRKLTYSSEQLDNWESERQQLRRAKSDSTFSKRKRGKGQKWRTNRAATTEEKVEVAQTGETPVVKKKRGRPRKNPPKEPESTVTVSEMKNDLEGAEEPNATIDTKEVEEPKDTAEEVEDKEVPQTDAIEPELDNAKEYMEPTTSSQVDTNVSVPDQPTDLKSARDEDMEPDMQSGEESTEGGPNPTQNTDPESLDGASSNAGELNQNVGEDAPRIKDKESVVIDEKPAEEVEAQEGSVDAQSGDEVGEVSKIENSSKNCCDVEMTVVLGDAMDVSANLEVGEVTQDMQEVSDSQLAEDIKLAEEILAAEVGKGVEVIEATGASVQGQQDPVTEIVKELELETISEVVEKSEEPTALAEQSPITETSPCEENPPIPEENPLTDENPVAGEEPSALPDLIPKLDTPTQSPKKSDETASGESSAARRTLRSDRPRSRPLLESTPVKEHESRSKRPIRNDISQILEESSRRNSPRLGRSPAESHDRSPGDRKGTPSKATGEKATKKTKRGADSTPALKNKTDQINATNPEDENTLEDEKRTPSETETEKPEVAKAVKPRKSRSAQRPLASKSPIPTKPDEENIASDAKDSSEKANDAEEVTKAEDDPENEAASSESEKPEVRKTMKPRKSRSFQRPLATKSPKPERENVGSDTQKFKDAEAEVEAVPEKDDQSSNKIVETPDSLEEKPVKRSKSRKGRKAETKASDNHEENEATRPTPNTEDDGPLNENNVETKNMEDKSASKMDAPKNKPGRKTPSLKLQSERAKNLSRSSNRDSDVPSDKEEKVTGRLSRRDKAVLEDSGTPKASVLSKKKKKQKKGEVANEEAVGESKEQSKERNERLKGNLEDSNVNHKEKLDSDSKRGASPDETEPEPEKCVSNDPKMDEIQDRKISSENEKKSVEGEASDAHTENTLHDKVDLGTDATEVSAPNEEPESVKSALDSKETLSKKELNKPKKNPGGVSGKIRRRRKAVTVDPQDRDKSDTVRISASIESVIPPTEQDPKSLFSNRKVPTKTYLRHDRKKPQSPSTTPSPQKQQTPAKETAAKDGDSMDVDSAPESNSQDTPATPAEHSEIIPKTSQSTPQKSDQPQTSAKPDPEDIAKSTEDTPSCRKLRILIKRTPTTKYQKARKSPIVRKTPTKPKRFKKILQRIEEVPVAKPEEQTEPALEGADVPSTATGMEELPHTSPDDTESENNSAECRSVAAALSELAKPREVASETTECTTNDSDEELKKKLPAEEEPIPTSEQQISSTDASSPQTVNDVVEERPSSDDPSPELTETGDIEAELVDPTTEPSETSAPEASDSPTSPLKESITETETVPENALESDPVTETDSSEITPAPALPPTESTVVATPDPESMEDGDATLDQEPIDDTPIPESTETTGVTVESESEASTSSALKRSLRKREADPSLPDG